MQKIKARNIVEPLIHGLFWLIVYFALNGITGPSFQMVMKTNGGLIQRMDGHAVFQYALVLAIFLMLLFYSSIFWFFGYMQRISNRLGRVTLTTIWLMLWYASGDILFDKLISLPTPAHKNIQMPPGGLTNLSSSAVSIGAAWSANRWLMLLIFMAILGIAAAYYFIKKSIQQEHLRNDAEALQLSTELRFLRSQVNPHFLFNTLNNLFSMAQENGDDELADGISKLAGMMRYMIDNSNIDRVPLSKEIDYLSDCIALSKLRHDANEISVRFTHPDAATSVMQIAPMLLVPFVENAFKHGIAIGRHSNIEITLNTNEKKLTFICENDALQSAQIQEMKKTGIGLENVKRRLQLLYPGRHKLVTQVVNGKYLVDLQIDLA